MNNVLDFFDDVIKKGHLSHSYLLAGTEDVDMAKTIAQRILCKQEHTGCGSCSSCLKLASDNHPDYMMITPDGASIKNAQVESFQEFVYIRPFESIHKIIIFDEAHLMTDRAQNRILKVLEEPPAYAVFIFLTHQVESMLDTVKSRCQIVQVKEDQVKLVDSEMSEKAIELIRGIEKQDAGRVLEYGSYLKQIKPQISEFLNLLSSILRDIMIFRETSNYQLITVSNLSILNYKDLIFRVSSSLSRGKNVELIELIEEVDQKLKSNMNYDLTVDKLLFKCIEREA
jgi:DNA polymerase III, gamma/tau subunits